MRTRGTFSKLTSVGEDKARMCLLDDNTQPMKLADYANKGDKKMTVCIVYLILLTKVLACLVFDEANIKPDTASCPTTGYSVTLNYKPIFGKMNEIYHRFKSGCWDREIRSR